MTSRLNRKTTNAEIEMTKYFYSTVVFDIPDYRLEITAVKYLSNMQCSTHLAL
jgi:hypothetical protein